jgi:RHS repeat-associated protein
VLVRGRKSKPYHAVTDKNGAECCANGLFPGEHEITALLAGLPMRQGELRGFVWYGSLMTGSTDQNGLMYRRNRYYNPGSGQFTQMDPIGIAGGLNAYGYANGDPINYSDPFGLRADTIPMELQQRLGNMCESIDCNKADIVTGGLRYNLYRLLPDQRALTMGNRIYLPRSTDLNSEGGVALVAHELTHSGDYQSGGAMRVFKYYGAGIAGQVSDIWGNPYEWRNRPTSDFSTCHLEQRG